MSEGKSEGLEMAIALKAEADKKKEQFKIELSQLINRLSLEGIESNGKYGIRDYILAEVGVEAIYTFAKNFHLELVKRG